MRHIRREIELEAPIDEVWAAVTRPERLSAWFGAQALEAVLRPGGRITFERQGEIWRGLVELVEPPRRFAFRWLPGPGGALEQRTRVEFRLEPIEGGTRLTVREAPLFEGVESRDRVLAGAYR